MQDKTLIHLREWLAQGDCARVAENCEKLAAKTPYRDNPDFFLIKADALRRLGRHQEAALAYRHGAGLSNSARAWLFAGSEHLKGKQNPQALDALRRALYLEPGLEQAHVLLCELLQTLAREREAFPSASRLREYGTSVRALCAAGYVFRSAMRYDESADCFRKALALKPDDWTVQGVALQTAQFALDWDAVEQYTRRLREDLYAQDPIPCIGEQHLTHVSWCMDEAVNERYAHAFLEKEFLKVPRNCYDLGKHRWGKRLKVGYVSADLRNHATLHLLCGVFCAHDRERFEIFAYDHSKDDKSWLRKRYLAAIEHHVDTTAMTDEEVADRVYADGIDVLVDLMGFTDKNRFGVFARRPAPVQVTYLGFPGATGADFIDYVISDPVVTPDSSKPFYTEKFCRLPDTYQCNDNARLTASNDLWRSDYGLPEEAFVFCCFNQSYKIDRETFETWMDVLRGVPGSVLWLLDAGEEARDTLRRQAELRGIAPERLAFAARELHPVHIRRSRLADLALDTRVYNGHTVTSDALWAGVPVVTAKGTHFASRVSASLLHAVGLDECVTGSMKEMGELAVALAHDADRLKALRERLGRNRLLFPLFDTERFTRHLERGYAMMAKRSLAGLPPDHLDVPALPPRTEPFLSGLPMQNVNLERVQAIIQAKQAVSSLQTALDLCPLCGSDAVAATRETPFPPERAVDGLPTTLVWKQCGHCGHLYRAYFWTPEGRARCRSDRPFFAEDPVRRGAWHEAIRILLGARGFSHVQEKRPPSWLEVRPQTCESYAAALECGFAPFTISDENAAVEAVRSIKGNAVQGDLLSVNVAGSLDVLSVQGLLERVPFPDMYLRRAQALLPAKGRLLLSFSNTAGMAWKTAVPETRPAWSEPERIHLYSLRRLAILLKDYDFAVRGIVPLGPDSELLLVAQKRG